MSALAEGLKDGPNLIELAYQQYPSGGTMICTCTTLVCATHRRARNRLIFGMTVR